MSSGTVLETSALRPDMKSDSRGRLLCQIGLASATALLIASAVPGLWRYPLWLDEAYTRAAIDNLGQSLSRTPGQMPLYYTFMWLWGHIGISPWWLRTPSLLCAFGTLVFAQRTARHIGGVVIAAVAPVVLVGIPMFSSKAIEARPYAAETLLVSITVFLILKIDHLSITDRRGRHQLRSALIMLAIMGPMLHALFVVFLLASAISVALLSRRRRELSRDLIAPCVAGLMTTLAMEIIAGRLASGVNNTYEVLSRILEHYLSSTASLQLVLGVLTLVGIVQAVVGAVRSRSHAALIPTIWISLVFSAFVVIAEVGDRFEVRYLSPITPILAIIIAAGLVSIANALRNLNGRCSSSVVGPLIVVLIATALVGTARALSTPAPEQVERWDLAAEYVAHNARDDDALAFGNMPNTPLQVRVPFETAWSLLKDKPTLYVASDKRQLGSVQRYDTPLSREDIQSELRGRGRVWLIDYRGSSSLSAVRTHQFYLDYSCRRAHRYQGNILVQFCVTR